MTDEFSPEAIQATIQRNVQENVFPDVGAKPFTPEQWQAYYEPGQMTGGTKMPLFNQLQQAPMITPGPITNTLLDNAYKFNGIPSVKKEVKDDGSTLNPPASNSRAEVRTIQGRTSANKKGPRRTNKSNKRATKRRSASSKKSIKAQVSKKKGRKRNKKGQFV